MSNPPTAPARNTISFPTRLISQLTSRISDMSLGLARRLSHVPSINDTYFTKLKAVLPSPSPVVIDVGANIGQFSGQVFQARPEARVFSIDPIPENVETCRQQYANRNGYRVVQAAVGEKSGPDITFHVIPGATQSSSVLPVSNVAVSNFRSLGSTPRDIQVPFRSLDDLLAQEGHTGPIDLLKIDVEGFEVPVLRGATETMRRSKALLVESQVQPMYEGTSLFDEVCHLARLSDFRFQTMLAEIRDIFGEVLIFDLLFVRRDDKR